MSNQHLTPVCPRWGDLFWNAIANVAKWRRRARKWKRLYMEAGAYGTRTWACYQKVCEELMVAERERDEARAWLHQTEEKMDALRAELDALRVRAREMQRAIYSARRVLIESHYTHLAAELEIAAGEPIP